MNFNLVPWDTEAYLIAADYQEEQGFLVPNAIRDKVLPFEIEQKGYRYNTSSFVHDLDGGIYSYGSSSGDGNGDGEGDGEGIGSGSGAYLYGYGLGEAGVDKGFAMGRGEGSGIGFGSSY